NAAAVPVFVIWTWADDVDPTCVSVKITVPFADSAAVAEPTKAVNESVAPKPRPLRLKDASPIFRRAVRAPACVGAKLILKVTLLPACSVSGTNGTLSSGKDGSDDAMEEMVPSKLPVLRMRIAAVVFSPRLACASVSTSLGKTVRVVEPIMKSYA